MFKEELIPILQITSRKEKMRKPFSIHFVKQMLPWYQDQTKIIKKKKKKNTTEQYLSWTWTQKLTKYWQIKFSNIFKRIIYHDQVGFIPEVQSWLFLMGN